MDPILFKFARDPTEFAKGLPDFFINKDPDANECKPECETR